MTLPQSITPAELVELLEFCAGLDLSKPAAARTALEARFPFDGAYVAALRDAMRAGVAAGELCHMGNPPVQYSRAFKATSESLDLSADAVMMTAPGPLHVHPNGEIDLCFAEEGEPTFDGHAPGWVVYPPGSKHVPTVAGGRMLILYLLPGGAIEFVRS